MKAKVKLYQSDGESENGFPVKLILSHKGKTRRRTLHYAHTYEWDHNLDIPRGGHPDYDALYDRISEIVKVSRTMDFMEIDNFDRAFDILLKTKAKSTPAQSFYDYAYARVEKLKERGNFGNAKIYETALDQLFKEYDYLTFSEITPKLLARFRDAKIDSGLKNSSVHNYLRTLRAIFNSADEDLTEGRNPFKGVFNEIPVKKRRARNRYFDKAQIDQLEKLDMAQSSLQRAIDLSLIQFYLCGIDLIDLYYMKTKQIANGRVFIKRTKLGKRAEEFDILLPKQAKVLIDKYARYTDDGYLFPWGKSHTSYKTFRGNHNRSLRVVKEREDIVLLPRDDKWTSKVMRHTFATIGKHYFIEEDLLRELMGHERNDIDTVYKDKYPQEDRDRAQMKIISKEETPEN